MLEVGISLHLLQERRFCTPDEHFPQSHPVGRQEEAGETLTHAPMGLVIKVLPSAHSPAPPAPKLGAKSGLRVGHNFSISMPSFAARHVQALHDEAGSFPLLSPHCCTHQAMCRMNPIPPSWPGPFARRSLGIGLVNPLGSAVMNTPQRGSLGRRQQRLPLLTAPARSCDFLGRDTAKGTAGLSGTSLQMSPSGAKARAQPRWWIAEATGFGAVSYRSPAFFLQQVWLALRLGLLHGAGFLPGLDGAFCLARRLSPHPALCDQIPPSMGQEVRSASKHSRHLQA